MVREAGNASIALENVTSWHFNLLNSVARGVVKCEIQINWHNDRFPNQPEMGHPLVNTKAALRKSQLHFQAMTNLVKRSFVCIFTAIKPNGLFKGSNSFE